MLKFERARTAALAAVAVLTVGGAGTALAQGPTATPAPSAAAPRTPAVVGGQTQQGDQTVPDVVGVESTTEAPESTTEAPESTTAASKTATGAPKTATDRENP